jgi:glycosyltransferase involved in cell wall biosynthesis
LLDAIAPDVIHTNGFKLHALGSRAARPGMPVVWHVHEYISPRRISRTLLQFYSSRPAAIVANSHSVADDLVSALGASAPVTSVYNSVDLAEFAPTGPVEDLDAISGLLPAPPNTIRVGLVATFARWKGHETFLRALGEIDPAIRAYIVGGPVYDTARSQYSIDELRELARSLGIVDRVGFTGFVARPAAAMRALDVVVHASTEPEPFGLVIAEGLACGKAVIVSAAGGAAELVEHDNDALTFEPGDERALARAIARCASDQALRVRLGAAGRRTAIRRFDPDVFTRAFLDIYTRVAGQTQTVAT